MEISLYEMVKDECDRGIDKIIDSIKKSNLPPEEQVKKINEISNRLNEKVSIIKPNGMVIDGEEVEPPELGRRGPKVWHTKEVKQVAEMVTAKVMEYVREDIPELRVV